MKSTLIAPLGILILTACGSEGTKDPLTNNNISRQIIAEGFSNTSETIGSGTDECNVLWNHGTDLTVDNTVTTQEKWTVYYDETKDIYSVEMTPAFVKGPWENSPYYDLETIDFKQINTPVEGTSVWNWEFDVRVKSTGEITKIKWTRFFRNLQDDIKRIGPNNNPLLSGYQSGSMVITANGKTCTYQKTWNPYFAFDQ